MCVDLGYQVSSYIVNQLVLSVEVDMLSPQFHCLVITITGIFMDVILQPKRGGWTEECF
jgi:hypothetical protein